MAFAFLRRRRALLCCAATAEYCVSKPSRRRRGDVAGSRQLVNTTQKSSGPCALLEAHLRKLYELERRAERVSMQDSLRRMPGPLLALLNCSFFVRACCSEGSQNLQHSNITTAVWKHHKRHPICLMSAQCRKTVSASRRLSIAAGCRVVFV